MKKILSLFLALVMVLSLCVTAFAGNATGSTVLRLTGDAADQVVDLKSGQRLSADSSTLVRLNVLDDPGAEEYTVMLDGKKLTPDHSTSQYHFYAVPAPKRSGVATLNVSTQADVGADAVSIATAEELAAFRDRVNNNETTLNAILTADIALDKSKTWTPIGTSDTMYAGIFDGNGHTISGLNVTGANNGLFKMTGTATIQNLTISDSTIGDSSNSSLLGAFVGRIKDSTTLINCHTTDTVTVSGGAVGGLVGGTDTANVAFTLTMERCSNAAVVSGSASSAQMGVGGLVGVLRNGATIKDCFNTGTVTNKSTYDSAAVGGLVGSVYNGNKLKTPLTLRDVYNSGSITAANSGTKYAGGLVGNAAWGFEMTNAYGTMTVKVGDSYGGIIVGTVQNTVNVSNIYSELIRGKNRDCHVYLYAGADKMSAVERNKMFNDTEMKAPDKLLAQLGETFAEDTANINNGYPVLAWQNAAPESAAQLTVSVGGVEVPVTLPTDGSTNASATPTAVTVEFENPGSDAAMDRIYFDMPEGVTLGTGLSKGVISGKLTKLDAGYTGNQLFFYKDPKAQTKSVKAIWNDGKVDHYYTITVKRAAQLGLVLGPNNDVYDAKPREAGASNKYNDDGFLKTMAWFSMGGTLNHYDAQAVYVDGTVQKDTSSPMGKVAAPDWDALKEQSNGMYFADERGYAYFARAGRYWLPISYTSDGTTIEGYTPVYVRLGYDTTFKYYIDRAEALDESKMSAEAQKMLTSAINTVNTALSAGSNVLNSKFMDLNAKGEYVMAGAEDSIGITGLDFFGAKLYAESLYEKDINTILDLTAIFSNTDETQVDYQWQAYQKILNMDGGIQRAIDIQSLADRDKYQEIRQAKWDLLKTTDLEGINAILTNLKLDNITPAEPQVTLGDVDGNGEINMDDAALLIRYCNNLTTLTDEQKAATELNGDGEINMDDAALLIRYCNNLLASFPAQS